VILAAFSADGYRIAGDILGFGATMSSRGAFIASLIALVFGIAWRGEASAQSSLPPCPPIGYVWDRCFGTLTWPDGGTYVGEYRDGKSNGHDTYTWPDGRKYVGNFKDDKFNGHGTCSRVGWTLAAGLTANAPKILDALR
jgi:hypothetical protein